MDDLISIIVPVYNTSKYLEQCIKSILEQTYKKLEIILVNDGSTDQSPQICEKFRKSDSRITVIHQENQGLSAARNKGIEAATGKYLMFVDSDDYIGKDMVETLYSFLIENNADMSMCSFEYVTDTGDRVDVFNNPVKDEVLSNVESLNKLLEQNSWYYVVAWNKLYKKALWDDLKYPVGYIHEDEAVIHKIFCQCNRIATTEKKLYYYRQVPGSITHQGRNIKSLDKYTAFADRVCFLERKYANVLDIKTFAYQYWYHYLDDYFFFKEDSNSIYLKRMKKSLYRTYGTLVRVKLFTVKDIISILVFLINPEIYDKIFRKTSHQERNN